MNYLFFDIETIMAETINPRIVSFGYVLTDDKFDEIVKQDIFIDPQEKTETVNNWKWKQDATKDKDGFKAFYHQIKELLEAENTIIVGHGTNSDVRYLSDECDRFHFEPIYFDYLDTKVIADSLLDNGIPKNLKSLYDSLCPNGYRYRWHRSLDDACMTKEVFKALFSKAEKENVNILDKEEFIFNSLRCVYGKLTDVAKRGEGYFSCNFDVPIIAIKAQCEYVSDTEQKTETIHLYYDYAVDRFFTPKHPKKGGRKDSSVLPECAYEKAMKRAVYKINKMWDLTKIRNNSRDFFYREGYRLTDMRIKHIFYALTSYEVYATYNKDRLEFDLKIPLSGSYLKNAVGYKKNTVVDLERIIKTVHTAETANRSLLLMDKMKFGYKDKNFPKITTEELPYSENTEYVLAREYANLLDQPNTKRGENDRLINGDTTYIPVEHAFDNDLFPERLMLPVLAKVVR